MSATRAAMFNSTTGVPLYPTTRFYTRTFADDAARNAATPDVVGQIGFQLDNSTFYRSDGTSAGEWASIFSLETLTVTSGLTVTGTTQIKGVRTAIATKTATYSVTVNDHTLMGDATSGALDMDLPAANTCAGQIFIFGKIDATANDVVIDPAGSDTVGAAAAASWPIESLGQMTTVQSDGVSNWIVLNDYTP